MNNKKNTSSSSSGLGLSGVLGVVFIILKLVGVINWSWWWVLSPFWISLGLTVLLIIGIYCYQKHEYEKSKTRWK